MVTVTIAVAALFSLVGGFLNKKIGRRLTIISASVLFGIGSLLLASAKGYPSLLIGKRLFELISIKTKSKIILLKIEN